MPLAECELFHRHLGGAPANVAVGLARLGAQAGLMTLVGPDAFGEFVRARLEQEGVSVSGIGVHRTAKTGVTFVSVARSGERSFLFFRHPSADQMISEVDVNASEIARARVLHVGSSTLSREPARAATLKAIELARSFGCVVSTDPNFRPHLWEIPSEAAPMLRRLVSLCDIVKISDDELPTLVGRAGVEEGARAVRALGPQLVVVTLGKRGCYFDAPGGQGYLAGETVKVVDTTGAGDAFVAGMLARLVPLLGRTAVGQLDEATLRAACKDGNRLGAQAVTALGATAGVLRTS